VWLVYARKTQALARINHWDNQANSLIVLFPRRVNNPGEFSKMVTKISDSGKLFIVLGDTGR
jgi:hypothetical protein